LSIMDHTGLCQTGLLENAPIGDPVDKFRLKHPRDKGSGGRKGDNLLFLTLSSEQRGSQHECGAHAAKGCVWRPLPLQECSPPAPALRQRFGLAGSTTEKENVPHCLSSFHCAWLFQRPSTSRRFQSQCRSSGEATA